MPHRAADLLFQNAFAGLDASSILSRPISRIEAEALEEVLLDDAMNYFFSAALAIAAAIGNMRQKHWSWPTVQLYYSVFYSFRALLATGGFCIFYHGKRPYILRAAGGVMPSRMEGRKGNTTHGVVLEAFRARFPGHYLLSQEIEGMSPIEWLTDRRVDANYRNARPWEPRTPAHLAVLERYSLRQLVGAYLQEPVGSYEFDPDHAMIAYPIRSAIAAKTELVAAGRGGLAAADAAFLRKNLRDEKGGLDQLYAAFCRHAG